MRPTPRLALTSALLSFFRPTSSPSSSASMSSTPGQAQPSFPTRPYTPSHTTFPYTPTDLTPMDPSSDKVFYHMPRFVNHIDDNAIAALRTYYAAALPRQGRVLDLCSSWVSHFPRELEDLARPPTSSDPSDPSTPKPAPSDTDANRARPLEVIGLGMNARELSANPLLSSHLIQDLNDAPALPFSLAPLDAIVCVVSIDYLTQPLAVLSSSLSLLRPGGTVHLVISNRCFPTKAVRRWLEISEEERLDMVGDYLHFAGFGRVEIVEVVKKGGWRDPLWVVRGQKEE